MSGVAQSADHPFVETWTRGLRRTGLVALAGLAATLAQPPVGAVPFLLFAFPILVWQIDAAQRLRGAFWIGWLFGFVHFLFGLYWVSFSMLVDIERHVAMLPLAIGALPAGLALFTGLVAVAYKALPVRGPVRPLAFALIWVLVEWIRGHVFTGFPWLLTGYSWTHVLAVLQIASVVGIYGLSLLTVAIALAPILALRQPTRRQGAIVVGGALVIATGVALWGGFRLASAPTGWTDDVMLRLVQPAIPQAEKWQRSKLVDNLNKHVALSAAPAAQTVTHVIWPETALTFDLGDSDSLRQSLAEFVPAGGHLLTGIPRIDRSSGSLVYHNSLVALDDRGAIAATFDKFHLVPFGEYMPLRWLLPFDGVAASSDFTPGPGPQTLRLPGLPGFSPLICYEAIFPGAVVDPNDRPDFLLNITNDAWFGETAGPHQHLAIARLRAIEEGLPMVRVANTGISAIVDPAGRILDYLPLGASGAIDTRLPTRLEGITLYAVLGDGLALLVLMVVLIFPITIFSTRNR